MVAPYPVEVTVTETDNPTYIGMESTPTSWVRDRAKAQPPRRPEHGELADSRLPLVLRDGHEILYRNSPLVNRMIGLCLPNRDTFESTLPNFPRDDRLEPRAIDNNKAPLPPTNDSARGEFD
jgi:hypothetical protein